MSKLGNYTSTNYVYLNPFFTLIASMIILGERMTVLSAAGSLAIVLGVILAGRK
jgi:drug/metabolite transporter (DMT)-like permease